MHSEIPLISNEERPGLLALLPRFITPAHLPYRFRGEQLGSAWGTIAICDFVGNNCNLRSGPMRLLPALLWLLSAWRSDALARPSLQLRGTVRPRIAISMVSPNKQAEIATALQRAITAAAAVTIFSQGVEPSLAEEFTFMLGVAPAYAADGGAGEQVRRRLEPRSSCRPAPQQQAARGIELPLSCR